ncbi:hypothetical protein [Lacticaseibacillus brantae]|nr:hypothetical protein [Lacticaseibacillus brantae]
MRRDKPTAQKLVILIALVISIVCILIGQPKAALPFLLIGGYLVITAL